LAFTGCNEKDDNIIDRDVEITDTPILVNANTTAHNDQTRAPWVGNENTLSATIKYDAYVLASTTNGDYTDLHTDNNGNDANRIIWTSDIATGFSDENGDTDTYLYPSSGNVYLVGLYPYTSATTGGGWAQATAGTVSATTTVTGTFDGKTDLMYAHQTSASTTNQNATLTFDHLGTMLQFYLKAEDAAAVAEWGDVTEITISGMAGGLKSTVTVTFATAATTYGSTATPIPTYGATYNGSTSTYTYTDAAYTAQTYELTTTATCQAYTILPPVTSDAATGAPEYTLNIHTVNGPTAGVDVKLQLETTTAKSTLGNSYQVTLNFKDTGEVGTDVSVQDWLAGTDVNQNVTP
jgi:hypothetical protein